MRLQLALNVPDIDEAVSYYSKLFGAAPHKRRDGYANFALDEPADVHLHHVYVETVHTFERTHDNRPSRPWRDEYRGSDLRCPEYGGNRQGNLFRGGGVWSVRPVNPRRRIQPSTHPRAGGRPTPSRLRRRR